MNVKKIWYLKEIYKRLVRYDGPSRWDTVAVGTGT